ncbi:hypothetical protein AVEN_92376-1 [Araneus ventricosus]|uniref:Uncharacterized protein n=1 Tax=Araneus ventricosus TaxID=182803 RepID=A0A4Y2AIV8_ARAVE|nr:hypothetical protein AVEN_92376-1 [Araneus ventricosus]
MASTLDVFAQFKIPLRCFSRGKYKEMPRRLFDKPDTNNSWVLPCAPRQNFWQISRLLEFLPGPNRSGSPRTVESTPKPIAEMEETTRMDLEPSLGQNVTPCKSIDWVRKAVARSDVSRIVIYYANRDDSVSIGGYILFLDETPISWRMFRQRCVSLSTMEAEYVTLTEAA